MSGLELLTTLKKLKYPGVEKLDAISLDWIFEDQEQLPFLEWFCKNVNEDNILSQEEIERYQELEQTSGALEGKQLEEALHTLSLMEDVVPDDLIREEISHLERDLEHAQHRKNAMVQQRNKLSLQHTALTDQMSQLENLEVSAKVNYKKQLEQSHSNNSQMNEAIEDLMKAVQELTRLYDGISKTRTSEKEKLDSHESVFLSQLDLQAFHNMEDKFGMELTNYTRKQFFEGIADIASEGTTTRYEFLEVSNPVALLVRGETQQVNLQECKDLARLQAIYPKGESQRINAQVEEQSTQAACHYMEDRFKSLKNEPFPKDITYLSEMVKDAEKKRSLVSGDLAQLAETQVPSLIKDSAQLQVSKVLRGDYDLKIARQDYFTSNQDQLIYHLISQRSRSEFLTMAFELELKGHRAIHQLLTAVSMLLSTYHQSLQDRLKMMGENQKSGDKHQRGTIDSRDKFILNLHQMLGEDLEKGQLFLTYNSLAEKADALSSQVSELQSNLASTCSNQDDRLALLESNLKACEDMVYTGSATRGGQPTLSPPSVLEALTQLDHMLSKVEHTVLDTIKDVEKKRKAIKNDPLAATERDLFVTFYNDHDRFRRAVEDVEKRLQAKLVQ